MNLLSKRENEVMQLVAKGLSNKQIANRLFISPRTVPSHLSAIYQKLCLTETENRQMTRLRAILIYLGLGKVEDW